MMLVSRSILTLSALFLAGCMDTADNAPSGGGPLLTTVPVGSQFADADDIGEIPFSLVLSDDTQAPSVGHSVTGTDIGYAVKAGFTESANVRAVAGLMPSTDIATPPTSGTATMTGPATVLLLSNIETRADGSASFSPLIATGAMELDVDFARGTVNGTAALRTGTLKVTGTFNDSNIEGTSTFSGIDGQFIGVIDENRSAGAAHGTSNDSLRAFSAGFVAGR